MSNAGRRTLGWRWWGQGSSSHRQWPYSHHEVQVQRFAGTGKWANAGRDRGFLPLHRGRLLHLPRAAVLWLLAWGCSLDPHLWWQKTRALPAWSGSRQPSEQQDSCKLRGKTCKQGSPDGLRSETWVKLCQIPGWPLTSTWAGREAGERQRWGRAWLWCIHRAPSPACYSTHWRRELSGLKQKKQVQMKGSLGSREPREQGQRTA
jgi:hypothetical protein